MTQLRVLVAENHGMRLLGSLLDDVFEIFDTKRCAACREPAIDVFCGGCSVLLDQANDVWRSGGSDASAFVCAGPLRDAIHRAKYGPDPYVAARLARLLDDDIVRAKEGVDCVVPVPLHARRLRERGFNVPAVFARRLARRWEVDCGYGLRRIRDTAPQVSLDAHARAANVRDAFVASGVKGRSVLLIDDVRTTGATLHEARRACERAGALRVRTFTLAVALGDT